MKYKFLRVLGSLFGVIIVASVVLSCSRQISLGTMHRVSVLPQNVHETSGLVYFNGLLLTQNDGGNPALVYGFEFEKYSKNTVFSLPMTQNIDWEELSLFDSSLVIADIGNNFNTRDTFTLYLAPIRTFTSHVADKQSFPADTTVQNVTRIQFTIPEKPKSTNTFVLSAFDMEAATQVGSKFFVFTKNWQTEQSVVYEVSCQKSGEARLCDTVPFRGLITSACTLPNELIAFVGYHSYVPFIAICKWDSGGLSLVAFRRFWGHWACQTEGICYVPKYGLLISAEKTALRRQAIYRVKMK